MKTSRRAFCQWGAAACGARVFTGAAKAMVADQAGAERTFRVLDPDPLLRRWSFWSNQDWDWYKANIPFWESPDARVDEIYYYRAEVLTKHLRYASPETGYIFTEFSNADSLPWAGRFNAIASATDLQLEEIRWLKTRQYGEDYARYWMLTSGAQPRNYGFPVAWSTWQMGLVHGDQHVANSLLAQYAENFRGWQKGRTDYPHDHGYDPDRQLFWNTGRDMGGEFNLASCQLSEELRGIPGYKIRGGAGYRPDINAVLFGEGQTIARIAKNLGRDDLAKQFSNLAEMLQHNTQRDLWDHERAFFVHRWRYDEYSEGDKPGGKSIRAWSRIWDTNSDRNGGIGYQPGIAGKTHGRELTGYIPWRFGLPADTPELASAWRFLMSEEYFRAPFGPTTAERNDPWFHVVYHACRHNGQSWPFHTARILSAGARLLDEYQHHGSFSREDWMTIFDTFTRMQFKNGRPHLAEAHSPFEDLWVQDEWPGLDYFHSSYIDHVLTGLGGLRPSDDGFISLKPLAPPTWDYFAADSIAYRNHTVSIVWDRTGERYKRGKGFLLFVDGALAAARPDLGTLRVPLAAHPSVAQPYEVILSANTEAKPFPKPSASFTAKYTPEAAALNGLVWFDPEYGDKWTCRGSWNDHDWYQIDFEKPVELSAVRLYFYADDKEVVAPDSYQIFHGGPENWKPVQVTSTNPPKPTAGRANTTHFSPIQTVAIRVVFRHPRGMGVGLAQIQTLAPNA